MDYRAWVRTLFAVLVIFAFAGFGLAMAGLEPYPSAVFPAFAEKGSPAGEIQFEAPLVLAWKGEEVRPMESDVLLKDLPESYYAAVLQNRFRYPNGSGKPMRKVNASIGGYDYSVRRFTKVWPEPVEQEWLSRIASGFESPPDSLVIQWQQHNFNGESWSVMVLPQKLTLDFSQLDSHNPQTDQP